MLSDRLIDRMGPVIDELVDRGRSSRGRVVTAHSAELRGDLGKVRREAISLRRYLAPQRDVMARLTMEQASCLASDHKALLREISDRTTRFVEDLDAARERAGVVQDELNSLISDQMNRTMYLLTVVAAVLLPPSLITGLLGINVGGVPGTDNPLSFLIVIVLLALLAVGRDRDPSSPEVDLSSECAILVARRRGSSSCSTPPGSKRSCAPRRRGWSASCWCASMVFQRSSSLWPSWSRASWRPGCGRGSSAQARRRGLEERLEAGAAALAPLTLPVCWLTIQWLSVLVAAECRLAART